MEGDLGVTVAKTSSLKMKGKQVLLEPKDIPLNPKEMLLGVRSTCYRNCGCKDDC